MKFTLLIILAFGGLIGTLVPAFPGTGLIFAGALVYAILSGFTVIGVKALVILLIMTLIGAIGQYALTSFGAKSMGASRYGIIGAIIGFFIGLLFIPLPGGSLLGAFAGAFCCEMGFALKTERESLKAGVGAVIGAMASFLFEFFIGLAMVIYIFSLLWPHLQPPQGVGPTLEVLHHSLQPFVLLQGWLTG
ncbi:MAG: DUF456 domain-containing protein [Deltaproteobacteria bacterium]|nr:DUF456 domain-containing protein [Candidatus Anaeroferrophillus wilburensis]MBN2890150.1 DUF456 domain-containing protein [Deltaproteobacteria bacterium]